MTNLEKLRDLCAKDAKSHFGHEPYAIAARRELPVLIDLVELMATTLRHYEKQDGGHEAFCALEEYREWNNG